MIVRKIVLLYITSSDCNHCLLYNMTDLPTLKEELDKMKNVELLNLEYRTINTFEPRIEKYIEYYPSFMTIYSDKYYNKNIGELIPNIYNSILEISYSHNKIIDWIKPQFYLNLDEKKLIIGILFIIKCPSNKLYGHSIKKFIPKSIWYQIIFPYLLDSVISLPHNF
jgi:hypothetical protein